jgi:hypothetical protein
MMMQKQYVRALKTTRVSRQACQRHNTDDWEEGDGIRLDYDCVLLQEEEDSQGCKDALYAKKWSVDRAILLHGQGEGEAFTRSTCFHIQMMNSSSYT